MSEPIDGVSRSGIPYRRGGGPSIFGGLTVAWDVLPNCPECAKPTGEKCFMVIGDKECTKITPHKERLPEVDVVGDALEADEEAATVNASAPADPGEGPKTGTGGPDAPGASEGHPERFCGRCGGPNISWAAPSPLWNQVMRGGDINGAESFDGIVCPTCFAILAEERGVAELWRFSAERVHAPLQTVTPSGRVWDERAWLWREPDGSQGLDAAIKAVAAAIHATLRIESDPAWEDVGDKTRRWCVELAEAAVRAAEPILRQAVAEEIARRLIEVGRDPHRNLAWMYPEQAAEIAREVGRG